jgi:small subunit ribosomal protein S11
MFQLKEFYQQKRDLLKTNKSLELKLFKRVRKLYKLPLRKELWGQRKKKWVRENAEKKRHRKKFAIFNVSSSLNNTFVALTDLKGKVRYVRSAGLCGFQGKKKRSTKFAVKYILKSVANFAKRRKILGVYLSLRGFSKPRRYVLGILKNRQIKVLGIRDITPNPHNGCRPKKKRRV